MNQNQKPAPTPQPTQPPYPQPLTQHADMQKPRTHKLAIAAAISAIVAAFINVLYLPFGIIIFGSIINALLPGNGFAAFLTNSATTPLSDDIGTFGILWSIYAMISLFVIYSTASVLATLCVVAIIIMLAHLIKDRPRRLFAIPISLVIASSLYVLISGAYYANKLF